MSRSAIVAYRITDSGCWEWMGTIDKTTGYGCVGLNYKHFLAHRWIWEQHRGPIPADKEIHHVCENRRCVNPKHFALVTKAEHALLNSEHFPAKNKAKTHCQSGHEFTEANTYTWHNMRHCRTCSRERYHRRKNV